MVRFIVATFALLGWGFYEMSGGADFEPASARIAQVETEVLPAADTEVTRVSLDLTSVQDVVASTAAQKVRLPQQQPPVEVQQARATTDDVIVILPSLVANVDPVPAPAPAPTTARAVTASLASTTYETRYVSGNRVNVRGGPGTEYGVVGRLVRGDAVEIIEDLGTGWVRFRALDKDTSGYIADFLLEG